MFRSLTLFLGLILAAFSIHAQNNCEYQLVLNDAAEDGWQGAGLTFFIETTPEIFTLNAATDTFVIALVDGDSISIDYTAGPGNVNNNFQLIDSDGRVLVNETNPSGGLQFSDFAFCPSCPAIVLNSVVNIDSFDNRILIDWEPSDSIGVYQIEYAPCGFLGTPDSVQIEMSAFSEATITNLRENTCYEYQISLVCLSGEQSIASGPHIGNTIFSVDVGISGAFAPQRGDKCAFSAEDTLFVFLKNYGAVPQSLVPFDFTLSYNGAPNSAGNVVMPEDGLYTGILVKDSCVAFPFEEAIDISEPGDYLITAFTSLAGDGDINNDTFTYTFSHSTLLPFFERFDDGMLPEGWVSDEDSPIIAGTITSELGPLNSRFTLTTERYGRISATDSLEFDYSFTDFGNSAMAATLTAGDQLVVEASRDCGESYEMLSVIDMNNFDASFASLRQINLPLAAFEGDIVSFRFTALRGGSSFRVLLDDINVYECSTENPLIVQETIVNTDEETVENGSITVRPSGGVGPYTFDWSTGFTEIGDASTLLNIGRGTFTVTITDAIDGSCFIAQNYTIGVVNTNELADIANLKLYPNPASESLNVDIRLDAPQALDLSIYNVMGQEMWSKSLDNDSQHFLPISVSNFNTGIYFMRVSSADGQITERFVVE